MKLTSNTVARLKAAAGKSEEIFFDDEVPGFGLRIRSEGSRTWIFQYKIGSKQRRMTLGSANAINLEQARNGYKTKDKDNKITVEVQGAVHLHARVKLGQDPAAEKEASRARVDDTFGKLVKQYLDFQKGNIRPRTLVEVTRHLEKQTAQLHALPIHTIDQRTIADKLNAIAKERGPIAANRARASLSSMFGWAMREGLAPSNPVANTNKREEQSRIRTLEPPELRVIWNALADDDYGTIIKLLMLTGQRANEIGGLRWDEIDFDKDVIHLPPERTKNGRAHDVPMSSTVRTLLKEQEKIEDRRFVFGTRGGSFSAWSKSKIALEERIVEASPDGKGIPHWVPHDLRRTAATGMADLGVLPHVIEAVLNHVSGHKGGIAGIYNKATYAAEKAQALALWDTHVNAVIKNRKTNITLIRRGA